VTLIALASSPIDRMILLQFGRESSMYRVDITSVNWKVSVLIH